MGDRAGGLWDALAVVALVAPVAGFLAGLAGARLAWPAATLSRAGCVLAAALWSGLLVAGAAPAVGRLDPDLLGMAAAAGAALLAAAVAEGEGSVPLVAGLAAAAAGAAATIVDAPESLGPSAGGSLVMVGAVLAASALAASGPVRLAVVVAPLALLAGLRGAAVLVDPSDVLAVVLAAAAAAGAWSWRRGVPLPPSVPLAIGAGAASLAPVAAARPAAALLAAAAVLVAAAPHWRWAPCAAFPGLAVLATALADVPAPDGPAAVVHVVYAALLAAAVAGVVVAPEAAPSDTAPSPLVAVPVGLLVAWLVVAPGSWRWAVPDRDAVDPWDAGAALAAGVGVIVVAVTVGLPLADRVRRAEHR
jgi:hypothetical protein